MVEREKIGVRVDGEVYERFKAFVEERHGRLHGVLGTELENAMRDRMSASTPTEPMERIENDVATIKAMLADAEGDGGTTSRSEKPHTHTGSEDQSGSTEDEPEPETSTSDDVPDEPPHPKASRAKKAAWLATEFDDGPTVELSRGALGNRVNDVYSFGEEATEALIEAALNHLDLEPHPKQPDTYLVGPERAEQIAEENAVDSAEEADARLDELDAADPTDAGDANGDLAERVADVAEEDRELFDALDE